MERKIIIEKSEVGERRVAIINERGKLINYWIEKTEDKRITGNIYLAKIKRIESAIQAVFIDYGDEKNGFVPISEIEVKQDQIEGNAGFVSRHNMTDIVSVGKTILVQAEKEIRGNKCAFFSTYINITGRYCILAPNKRCGHGNSISKKIKGLETERLNEIIESLDIPEGMSCIIKTAGQGKSKLEITRDWQYLLRLWNNTKKKIENSEAPTLVYDDGNIIKRSIRDYYKQTTDRIIVHGQDAFEETKAFIKIYAPKHVNKVELYNDELPLFDRYGIATAINEMLQPIINLPSGGTIVINTTEALTAIDVNSGKTKHGNDLEITAINTNLEAIEEIGRQIKLRDIGGLIVIDFIDMHEESNKHKVEKAFRKQMNDDIAKIQYGGLSQFCLMEISRQRIGTSINEQTMINCKHCNGTGRVISTQVKALTIIRSIESFVSKNRTKSIVVEVRPGMDLFLLNKSRYLIVELEQRHKVQIEIVRNKGIDGNDCKIHITEYAPDESTQLKQLKAALKQRSQSENAKKIIKKKKIKHKIQEGAQDVPNMIEVEIPKPSNDIHEELVSDNKFLVTPEIPLDYKPIAEMPDRKKIDRVQEQLNKKPEKKSWLRKIFE